MAYKKPGHVLVHSFVPANLLAQLDRHAKVRSISRSNLLAQLAIKFVESNEADLERLEEEARKWL